MYRQNTTNCYNYISRKALAISSEKYDEFENDIKHYSKKVSERATVLLRNKTMKNDFNRADEYDLIDKSLHYSVVIKLLKKEMKDRIKPEIGFLSRYMTDKFNFFKKLNNNDNRERLDACLKVLKFQRYPENVNIINYGDIGIKFCVILKGTVGIYKHKFIEKEMSMRDFIRYLNYIKYIEKNDVKLKRIEEKNNSIYFQIYEYDPDKVIKNILQIFLIELEEIITEKKDGDEFGEISLIQKCKTTATVKTLNICDIAYINKNDYNHILREMEEKKYFQNMEEFKNNFFILRNVNLLFMSKIMNFFTILKIYENETVYDQYSDSEYIYFIIKGKFEMSIKLNLFNFQKYINYVLCEDGNLYNYLKEGLNNLSELLKIKEDKKKILIEPPFMHNNLIINDNQRTLTEVNEYENDYTKIYRCVLRIISDFDVLGLEEGLELKKRYCTIKCISQGELFRIRLDDFLLLLKQESIIDDIYNSVQNKKKILIHRIQNFFKCIIETQRRKSQTPKIITPYVKNPNPAVTVIEDTLKIKNSRKRNVISQSCDYKNIKYECSSLKTTQENFMKNIENEIYYKRNTLQNNKSNINIYENNIISKCSNYNNNKSIYKSFKNKFSFEKEMITITSFNLRPNELTEPNVQMVKTMILHRNNSTNLKKNFYKIDKQKIPVRFFKKLLNKKNKDNVNTNKY